MRRKLLFSIIATTVVISGVVAATGQPELRSLIGMKKLGVVIYVTPEVMQKGALVSILTRKVPAEEFESRFPAPKAPQKIAGAPTAERQWYGVVTGPVNMVYFEVPDDGSYTYRFRSAPVNGRAEDNVSERVLTVGGIVYDADGREQNYIDFGVERGHEIIGNQLSLSSLESANIAEDFGIDPSTCPLEGGVRVCIPDTDALLARSAYVARSSGTEVGHPWER